MNDTTTDFEDRLRAMLHTRARDVQAPPSRAQVAAVPMDRSGVSPTPSRRRTAAFAAAAVVVSGLLVTAALLRPSGDHEISTGPADQPGVASSLPSFDPATAPVVFTAAGDVEAVLEAYLRDRFPDYPAPGLSRSDVMSDGELATANWQLTGDGPTPYGGSIYLRKDNGAWGVTAATTTGVDLADLVNDGQRVHGRVTSSAIDLLAVDLLDLNGEPVTGAPRPEGLPGANYRYGTAGESNTGVLDLDIPVTNQTAVVRVHLVGGTLLSIAEVALVPPPTDAPAPGASFVVWPNDATPAKRSDPVTTARSFAEQVVGRAPTSAEADPDAPAGGPTWVEVDLDTTRVRILTAPTDDGWVVLQVGDGGGTVTTDPPSVHPPAVAGAVEVEVRIDTVTGINTVTVSAAQLQDGVTLPTAGTDLRSIVAIYRGSQGEVIAVNGGHFG